MQKSGHSLDFSRTACRTRHNPECGTIAEFTRRTPGAPVAVRLVVETCGRNLVADGSDAVFVRAQITDEHGEIVRSARVPVTFSVSGPARLISPAQATSEQDGVATMLLQASDQAGKIRVTATAGNLRPAEIVVRSVELNVGAGGGT